MTFLFFAFLKLFH